jgi:hypothetical protein
MSGKIRVKALSSLSTGIRSEEKLQMVLDLLAYAEKPEAFVRVVKEVALTSEMMKRLKTADTNPYAWFGLTK